MSAQGIKAVGRPWTSAAADGAETAVIDVGSNSVRLVVFWVSGRSITPVLNEKVMAGLGRGLQASGMLDHGARDLALAALRRFAALVEARGVRRCFAVATAAVRSAADGQDFVDRVRRETGLNLQIINGREEARLSALGVLAGAPDAKGLVGDLGGSSLELVPIGPDGPGEGETFALGPLALAAAGAFDVDAVAARVDKALGDTRLLRPGAQETFYAVGGAWRALGRFDIALRGHPIGVLHQHAMTRADTLKVADFVRRQSRRSLERFEESAAKRADTLPFAATVIARLLELGGFEKVVLSSYGLREGLLFDAMGPELRAQDALIAGAEAFVGHKGLAFAAALERFVTPLFVAGHPAAFAKRRDAILRQAACRLADIGAALHPDQREVVVFELVLGAQLAGVAHPERAFLAATVQHRYTKSLPESGKRIIERLLTPEQAEVAAALGLALRLGCDLSGRTATVMDQFSLRREKDQLILTAASGAQHLVTDQAVRRLDPLAEALKLKAVIRRR
ncbi:MAG: Ppx/GppA family phosphatase [Alphaproteobacteria bacterium]|nr:Ppx/GppA family phosphatase [Alphaproteobacteria bacterium]